MPHRILAALLLLLGREAAAAVEFVATAGGERLCGANVCFFRGAQSNNPIVRFGTDARVRCLSADEIHDMRPGVWNYYLRHSSGYVSAFPGSLEIEGGRDPNVRQLLEPLRRAGVLDFQGVMDELAEGEHFAVYVSNVTTTSDLATILPLPRGTTTMFVPAGEKVLPLIVRQGRISRVGDVLEVAADQTLTVQPFSARKTADVVSWIKIDYEVFDRVRDRSALSIPVVDLTTSEGATVHPLLPLRAGTTNELSLLVFRNVPFGRYTISIRGDTWESSTLDVEVLPSQLTSTTDRPLRAVPRVR